MGLQFSATTTVAGFSSVRDVASGDADRYPCLSRHPGFCVARGRSPIRSTRVSISVLIFLRVSGVSIGAVSHGERSSSA